MKHTLHFLLIPLFACLLAACGSNETQKNTAAADQPGDSTTSSDQPEATAQKRMIFFGNSLTAGYQLDPNDAFPALIGERLDSLGYDYKVLNAGLSGETSSGGLERVDWIIDKGVDVFVLELGANDGLRGIPTAETRENLKGILDKVRARNPMAKLIIAGMQVPPNMGPDYAEDFRSIFPELAEAYDAVLIPFLLEGVAGKPDLNLADGIHPTEEGYKIVTETVWDAVKQVITK